MQDVLTALNMILESRERRERADVQASLSGMELYLKEKEMGSLALHRQKTRDIQKRQVAVDEARMAEMKDKNFREKLTQIQARQELNLNRGAESMFASMFNNIWLSNTAGGQNVQKTNINDIVKQLKNKKEYGFKDADAKKLANYIVSYGLGVKSGSPNSEAMVAAANLLNEEAVKADGTNREAMVRGGMMPDPNINPESFKAWIETMKGMQITKNNLITISKDWADFTDDDPKNDYDLRPLGTIWDYKTGSFSGTGGKVNNLGDAINKSLSEAQDMNQRIADWTNARDEIMADGSLTKTQKESKINALKYIGEEIKDKFGKGTGEYASSDYQTIMGGYNVGEGQFALGYQDYSDSDLEIPKGATAYKDAGLWTDVSDFANLDPEDAVDYIAGKRDVLLKERKDTSNTISKLENSIHNVASRGRIEDMSVAVRTKHEEDKINLFRETQRMEEIDNALNDFFVKADIETEKHLSDGLWDNLFSGASKKAREFRTGGLLGGSTDFPTQLLTKTEREKEEGMSALGQSLINNSAYWK